MKLLEALAKLFVTDTVFHEAVRNGRTEHVAKYIKLGLNVNSYYVGYTLLQHSLLRKRAACTLLLLENGADPNLYSRMKNHKRKILQLYIQGRVVNEIKLLALYGANLEDITFTEGNQYLQKLVLEKIQDYQQRKKLEQDLKKPTLSIDEQIEIYKELKHLWAKQCENETNPVYLNHYQQKAHEYQLKAQQSAGETKPTTTDFKSIIASHSKEEELAPLLEQPTSNKVATKLKMH